MTSSASVWQDLGSLKVGRSYYPSIGIVRSKLVIVAGKPDSAPNRAIETGLRPGTISTTTTTITTTSTTSTSKTTISATTKSRHRNNLHYSNPDIKELIRPGAITTTAATTTTERTSSSTTAKNSSNFVNNLHQDQKPLEETESIELHECE